MLNCLCLKLSLTLSIYDHLFIAILIRYIFRGRMISYLDGVIQTVPITVIWRARCTDFPVSREKIFHSKIAYLFRARVENNKHKIAIFILASEIYFSLAGRVMGRLNRKIVFLINSYFGSNWELLVRGGFFVGNTIPRKFTFRMWDALCWHHRAVCCITPCVDPFSAIWKCT